MKKILTILILVSLVLAFWVLPSPEKKVNTQASFKLNLDPTGKFIADELIMQYKDGVTEETIFEEPITAFSAEATSSAQTSKKRIKDVLSDHQALITKEKDLNGAKVIKVPFDKREKLLEKLKNNPNVEYVEKNFVGKTAEGSYGGSGGGGAQDHIANDPIYTSGNQFNLWAMNVPHAWLINKGSSSSSQVAVLDSGVDYNHPDLGVYHEGRIIKGYDYINDDPDPMDDFGHGTQVASIISARTNNATDIAGINWYNYILAVKVCDANDVCPADALAAGINYAANRPPVKIINISLIGFPHSQVLASAITNAKQSGKLIVSSTYYDKNGNDGTTHSNCFMAFPAAYSDFAVVSINKASQWSRGCSGVKGPNGNTYSPNIIAAPGQDITALKMGGGTQTLHGSFTSYSAPQISGILSILTGCTNNNNAKTSLITKSFDLGSPGYDSTYGWGVPNAANSVGQYCY